MKPYVIETAGKLDGWMEREWLLTNGTGAFSGSTVLGCNTRRYHGLLFAAITPPVGRIATVNRIGEIFRIDGSEQMLETSVNQFRGSIHPRGDQYLRRFELDDTVRWHFDVQGVKVLKELQLVWHRNIAIVRYTIDPGGHQVNLELLPFVALRDFHALRRGKANFGVTTTPRGCRVADDKHQVYVQCDAGEFRRADDWWLDHVMPIESERGQDDVEDLYVPGRWSINLDRKTTLQVTISTDQVDPLDFDKELSRRKLFLPQMDDASETVKRLVRAANDFIVARKKPDGTDGFTVIAGYPWFADWGRDTMISLPGLFLHQKRFAEAAAVLGVFAQYISQGMIPNRFNDYTNEPEYNTVDASLWFIHACFEFRKASGDQATFKDKLLPACRLIVQGYRNGTRYGIKMDAADGLITQGDESTQLTWMDAKCNGIAFTPRQGKPVEINALWYHALCLMSELDPPLKPLAGTVRQSFAATFFLSESRGCADVVNGQFRDASIRPNQIFAVSLPNSALSEAQQRAVVGVVERELLTPVGLKTLAAGDPKYCPTFTGIQMARDAAYHNGTIWPWPIGAFLDAYLKVHKRSPAAVSQAKAWLRPLIEHLNNDACIGSISEVFEAGTLRPAGCCAQAWSVAEALRLAIDLEL